MAGEALVTLEGNQDRKICGEMSGDHNRFMKKSREPLCSDIFAFLVEVEIQFVLCVSPAL